MKVKVKRLQEIELSYLKAKMGIRYFIGYEYSEDNGKTWVKAEEDDDETDKKFREHLPLVDDENYWTIHIDLVNGKVLDWPKDFCVRTYFKICDDGEYSFLDELGEEIINLTKEYDQYYVPIFLSLEDDGYGDYVYININGDGSIEHFNKMKDRIECYIDDVVNA